MLISKLSKLGVTGRMLSWFRSYLSDRESTVVVNGFSSDSFQNVSGVPQGSRLGPLLFNAFINDIGTCFLKSDYYLFADDLKLVKPIKSVSDCGDLQGDLDGLVRWCSDNGMDLNVEKCLHIRFSRNLHVTNAVTYQLSGRSLARVDEVRDLGVTLDSKLQMSKHIDHIVTHSFKMLGFIRRNTHCFRYSSTIVTLYNSLVRSSLEYCSPVWNPHYSIYINRIESVQKRFLWHLAYKYGLAKKLPSYDERLDYFRLSPLSDRRLVCDMVFLHRLVTGAIDSENLLARLAFNTPSRLPRTNRYRLFYILPFKTNLGQHAPLTRLCRNYNDLTHRGTSEEECICLVSDSLHKFKKSILKLAETSS